MHEIPKPELLNPDRVDRDDREEFTGEDHRSQAQLLAKALGESCAYAEQLWDQLNMTRAYLLESLPPDPRTPGAHRTASASPTGPGDERGWERWVNTFANTTSVLCGAHGDSGFGLSRAREEAQLRRTAPELTVVAEHPEVAAMMPPEPPSPAPTEPPAARKTATSMGKAAAAAIIGVLALRGLRPAPRRDRSA